MLISGNTVEAVFQSFSFLGEGLFDKSKKSGFIVKLQDTVWLRTKSNNLGVNFGLGLESVGRDAEKELGPKVVLNYQSEHPVFSASRFGHDSVPHLRLKHDHCQINHIDVMGEMLQDWGGDGIRKVAHDLEA